MSQWLRFANKEDVIDFLETLQSNPGFPITGSVNGVPAPQNQKTDRFSLSPLECEDGKFAVPEPDDNFYLNRLGMTTEERDILIADKVTAVGGVPEEWSASWFPDDEDTFINHVPTATIVAKSDDGTNVPDNLKDSDINTGWRAGGDDPQWIRFDLGTPTIILGFVIVGRPGDAYLPYGIGFPRDFTFNGSDDGTNWDTLRTLTNEIYAPGERVRYRVPLPVAYRYYGLQVSRSAPNDNLTIAQVKLFSLDV